MLRFGKRERSRRLAKIVALAAAGATPLVGASAFAGQTLYWDPGQSGPSSTPSGGSGTWDLGATADWYNVSSNTDTTWTDASATGADTAIFGGTAGTVSLVSNLSAYELQFNTTGYTLQSSGDTLGIGAGGINASALTSGTTTFGSGVGINLLSSQTWTIGSGGTISVAGVIAGASSNNLSITGGGTVSLTGANTYSGTTTLNNGTLLLDSTGGPAIAGNLVLQPLPGSGAVQVKLLANNQIAPTSTVTIGTYAGLANGINELNLNGFSNTLAGLIFAPQTSGQTVLVATGAGTLTLNGPISFNGPSTGGTNPITISGNLNLGGAVQSINAIPGNRDTGSILTISALVSNGGINQTYTGEVILSANDTFTGGTTVGGGTLELTGSLPSGTALTTGPGTFAYAPTVASATQSFSSLTLVPGGSNVSATSSATLTLGTLTRSLGSTVNFSSTGTINVTSALSNGILGPWATYGTSSYATLNGSQVVAYTGATAADGVSTFLTDTTGTVNYDLSGSDTLGGSVSADTVRYVGTAAGTITTGSNTLALNGLLNASTFSLTIAGTGPLVSTSGELVIAGNSAVAISAPIADNGAIHTTLTDSDSGVLTLSNTTNSYSGGTYVNNGATIAIAGTGDLPTNGVVFLNGGTLQINGSINLTPPIVLGAIGGTIRVNNVETVQQNTNIISGTGGLTITAASSGGSDIFASNAQNTYSGGTFLQSGTLVPQANSIGSASTGNLVSGPFGVRTLFFQGGNMRSTTAGSYIIGNAINISAGISFLNNNSNTITFTGPVTLSTGTQTITQASTGPITFSGAIGDGGNGYGITTAGSGTLIFSGANTYKGPTTIGAGTLQLGSGGTTGSLNPLSAITDNATLIFNRSNAVVQGTDFASVIGGSGSVAQNGTGTLTLSGANTYGGTTTVNAGTLLLSGSLQSSGLVTAAGTFNYSPNPSGGTQGFSSLTINAGGSNVVVAAGANLQLGSITHAVGGTVNFAATGAITSSGTSNTNGILGPWATYATTSYATINNSSQIAAYTGATVADGSTVTLSDTSGTVNYDLTGNDTLAASVSANTVRYLGTAAGTIAIGTNTLSLNGILNAAGSANGLTITAGTGGSLAIGSNNELDLTGNSPITISAPIVNDGSTASVLTDSDSGVVTLGNASNTYSGGTFINNGAAISIAGANALSTAGTVTIDGGSLIFAGNFTLPRAISIALEGATFNVNGTFTGQTSGTISGPGALTITGTSNTGTSVYANGTANTYSGGTYLVSGTFATTGSSTGSASNGTLTAGPLGTGTLYFQGGSLRTGVSVNTYTLGNAVSLSGGVTFIASNSNPLTLSGPVTLVGSNQTITQNSAGNVTFSGLIGDGGNNLAITKAGTGTLIFSGGGTYTGGTNISAGMLLANAVGASVSSTGTGPVNIASGATLGGTGVIRGTNAVVAVNGTITAGNGVSTSSTPGLLITVGGAGGQSTASQIWNGGGAYTWKVNPASTPNAAVTTSTVNGTPVGTTDPGTSGSNAPGTNWDMLAMTSLSIQATGPVSGGGNGVFTINLTPISPTSTLSSGNYTIADVTSGQLYVGSNSYVGASSAATELQSLLSSGALQLAGSNGLNSSQYTLNAISDGDAQGFDIVVTATSAPEPGSFALVGLGAGGLLIRRRRRARKSQSA